MGMAYSSSESSEALRKKADTFLQDANFDEALSCYKASLAHDPQNIKALHNFAKLHEKNGSITKAISLYRAAIDEHCFDDETAMFLYKSLADCAEASGKSNLAIWAYSKASKSEKFPFHEIAFACLESLRKVKLNDYDEEITDLLGPLLLVDNLDRQIIADIYFDNLGRKIKKIFNIANPFKTSNISNQLVEEKSIDFFLSGFAVRNIQVEMALRKMRKAYLTAFSEQILSAADNRLINLIAQQQSRSGAIWGVEEIEESLLSELRSALETKVIDDSFVKITCSILAMYEAPISKIQNRKWGKTCPWPSYWDNSGIIFKLESANPDHVCASFYTENPYPQWSEKPTYSVADLDEDLKSLVINNQGGIAGETTDYILIAGCGTGQQAIRAALTYPKCRVVGLDISLASIEFANIKKVEFRITNLSFILGDLSKIQNIGLNFRLIECVGVLHHMKDEFLALRSLLSHLTPQGVLKVGLYSSLARRPIRRLAQICMEKQIKFNSESIESVRTVAIDNSEIFGLESITSSHDFFDRYSCNDLLFHPRERGYCISEIKEICAELDCEFAGFQTSTFAGDEHFIKFDSTAENLEINFDWWSKTEEEIPSMFGNMYIFWLRPKRSS
ncbi:methyltransferase domain-containing protein [Pseudomonas sp. MG-9]|uniref:class I SAM-dependent methyltransferase n=1 Tax=Pseudomonas sp. MG-9 TaxID=2839032 RepID=UPI001C001806|nr:class I SAM-dependent methyltransferase [Pseudomonas sp. MG-9]MBT9263715.1 methyltransferase domain-containing protein [Pseudomonas sp. MG-9]